MASTFSDLGIELMATGENAGTWGTKTNTNLQIVEKAIAGYVEKSIAGGAQTTTLSITDELINLDNFYLQKLELVTSILSKFIDFCFTILIFNFSSAFKFMIRRYMNTLF